MKPMQPGGFRGMGASETEGAPAWAMTYGDLMSLLLVFFVLIASYSTLDVVKYRNLVGSVQDALGTRDRTLDDPRLDAAPTQGIASAAEERERRQVEREVEALVQEIGGPVKAMQTSEGMRVRIEGAALFRKGEAELLADAMPLLELLAPSLQSYPYRIEVEGHTDDIPIHTARYPSNWELSSARAATVVRHFIDAGLDPKRLVAIGNAQTRPVRPNDTEENRAQNRRVEFLLSVPNQDASNKLPVLIPDPIGEHLPQSGEASPGGTVGTSGEGTSVPDGPRALSTSESNR